MIIIMIVMGTGIIVTILLPIDTFVKRFYIMLPLLSVMFLISGWGLWLDSKGVDWLMVSHRGLQKGKMAPTVPWEDIVEIKPTTTRDIIPGGFLLRVNAPLISVDIRDDASCLKGFDFDSRLSAKIHSFTGHGELVINPISYKENYHEVLDVLMEFYMAAVPTAIRVGDRCGTEINDA